MNWSTFWTAISAIGTMIACVIAIFQPIVERKIFYRRQLKLSFVPNKVAVYADKSDEYFCAVTVLNKSYINICVTNVALLINGKQIQQVCMPNNVLFANILPYELSSGAMCQFNFSNNALQEVLKTLNSNSKIYIIATDSFGKIYKQKTNVRVKDILFD